MFRLRVLLTIAFIAANSGGAQFPVTPDGTAQGAYRVGDRVEWMLGDSGMSARSIALRAARIRTTVTSSVVQSNGWPLPNFVRLWRRSVSNRCSLVQEDHCHLARDAHAGNTPRDVPIRDDRRRPRERNVRPISRTLRGVGGVRLRKPGGARGEH